jgi:hypothetical protein
MPQSNRAKAGKLTTDEAIGRLFPRAVIERAQQVAAGFNVRTAKPRMTRSPRPKRRR